jgi:hypothetical protein
MLSCNLLYFNKNKNESVLKFNNHIIKIIIFNKIYSLNRCNYVFWKNEKKN